MLVSKKLKLTTLLIAMACVLPSLASYKMTIPLEITQGGALADNTIVFGSTPKTDTNNGETPSNNCIYNSGSFVQELKSPVENYQAGDRAYIYNNTPLGFYSPSNGMTPPSGVSMGKKQTLSFDAPANDYEICFDSTWVPPIGNPDDPIGPNPNEHSGPDWTPECILNTSTDYAAISSTTGKREFHSVQFGLNHLVPSSWNYVPPDYNPNNPTSYIYFDQSEQSGDPRVSGPNTDFSYAQICRVRKRDL